MWRDWLFPCLLLCLSGPKQVFEAQTWSFFQTLTNCVLCLNIEHRHSSVTEKGGGRITSVELILLCSVDLRDTFNRNPSKSSGDVSPQARSVNLPVALRDESVHQSQEDSSITVNTFSQWSSHCLTCFDCAAQQRTDWLSAPFLRPPGRKRL